MNEKTIILNEEKALKAPFYIVLQTKHCQTRLLWYNSHIKTNPPALIMNLRLSVIVDASVTAEQAIAIIKRNYPGIKISTKVNQRIFKLMTYEKAKFAGDFFLTFFADAIFGNAVETPYINVSRSDFVFLTTDSFNYTVGNAVTINCATGRTHEVLARFGRISNIKYDKLLFTIYYANGMVLHIPYTMLGDYL